jgi:hypothetical protein
MDDMRVRGEKSGGEPEAETGGQEGWEGSLEREQMGRNLEWHPRQTDPVKLRQIPYQPKKVEVNIPSKIKIFLFVIVFIFLSLFTSFI